MADPARPRAWRTHPAAPGEGCLLGQRDQAVPGAGRRWLPRLHPQGRHRHFLPGLRPLPAQRAHPRGDLPAVRQPQRPHRDRHPRPGRRSQGRRRRGARLRVPAPARHGRRAVRHGDREVPPQRAHLRPGRRAQGPAAVPGPPPAGERRQLFLRAQAGGPARAGGDADPAPGYPTAPVQDAGQRPYPSAPGDLRRRAEKLPGHQHEHPEPVERAGARLQAAPDPPVASRADRQRREALRPGPRSALPVRPGEAGRQRPVRVRRAGRQGPRRVAGGLAALERHPGGRACRHPRASRRPAGSPARRA